MINLIETPQRADIKIEYITDNDVLTVIINDTSETFDFNGFPDGKSTEIIAEILPLNPILSAEKIGDIVNINVIRFYGEDEKEVFENGTN